MNPRKYSQIERALSVLDRSATSEILKDDHYLLFLFKKTERIVAALYVITGLIQDQEPLKWNIRESGMLLLQHTLSFKTRATAHSREFLSDACGEVAHLLSLLDLAHIADLLSPMNLSVLKKELDLIVGVIEGKWRLTTVPASPPLFGDDFFGITKDLFSETKDRKTELAVPFPSAISSPEDTISTLRTITELERFKREQENMYKGQSSVKDSVLNQGGRRRPQSRVRTSSLRKPRSAVPVDRLKEERKQRIIEMLRTQNTAVVRDFLSVISGCSEKTIQRLLIEMVRGNVLKREGARRWSRYSIAGSQVDQANRGDLPNSATIVRES